MTKISKQTLNLRNIKNRKNIPRNMIDRRNIYSRQYINGNKKCKIGILTGIFDKNNIELKSGDIIKNNLNRECIILYDCEYNCYVGALTYSNWYNNRNPYDINSYGKIEYIFDRKSNNGYRMEFEKIDKILE